MLEQQIKQHYEQVCQYLGIPVQPILMVIPTKAAVLIYIETSVRCIPLVVIESLIK